MGHLDPSQERDLKAHFREVRATIDAALPSPRSRAMPDVYIASKVVRAAALRELAKLLLATNACRVTSSWLHAGEVTSEAEKRALWLGCVTEARAADLVLLMVDEGDTLKGCLIECGAALAHGKPVFQIGTCHSLRSGDGSDGTFTGHPLWFRADDIADALGKWRSFAAHKAAGATP